MTNLKLLAIVVMVMVAIDALWEPAILSWAKIAPYSFTSQLAPIARAVDIAELVFRLVTMILFGIWIVLAGKNLLRAEYQDLEFTPGSRVWWFVVPFACFVKPFQGMRELWNASHGNYAYDQNNGLLGAWWALWLASNITGYVSARVGNLGTAFMIVDDVLGIAAGVAAILLVRAITDAQQQLGGPQLAEVFA